MKYILLSLKTIKNNTMPVLSRVKGVTKTAAETGLSRKGVRKALSEDGNPEFASVNAIIHAMGYRLSPQKLETQENKISPLRGDPW